MCPKIHPIPSKTTFGTLKSGLKDHLWTLSKVVCHMRAYGPLVGEGKEERSNPRLADQVFMEELHYFCVVLIAGFYSTSTLFILTLSV